MLQVVLVVVPLHALLLLPQFLVGCRGAGRGGGASPLRGRGSLAGALLHARRFLARGCRFA